MDPETAVPCKLGAAARMPCTRAGRCFPTQGWQQCTHFQQSRQVLAAENAWFPGCVVLGSFAFCHWAQLQLERYCRQSPVFVKKSLTQFAIISAVGVDAMPRRLKFWRLRVVTDCTASCKVPNKSAQLRQRVWAIFVWPVCPGAV